LHHDIDRDPSRLFLFLNKMINRLAFSLSEGYILKDMMDKETIQQLFIRYYAKMLRVARTLLYDEQESEDVVSDIFEGLLHRETLLLPGTEERYLLVSVRNRCLKRLRHETIVRSAKNKDSVVLNETSEDDLLTDIVEFVVGHATEQEQRIFRLRFTEGYSYEAIAASENISRIAVWKHLSHIITEIKKQFNPQEL